MTHSDPAAATSGTRQKQRRTGHYEFSVKVSVATRAKHSAGSQFVARAVARSFRKLHALLGNVDRIIEDEGCRSQAAPDVAGSGASVRQRRRIEKAEAMLAEASFGRV